jgi:hypothetical protein
MFNRGEVPGNQVDPMGVRNFECTARNRFANAFLKSNLLQGLIFAVTIVLV